MNLGVIVGRFQVPELHEGQRLLIEHVWSNHQQVLVLLGVSEAKGTKHDPLDFITREKMLKAMYPSLSFLALPDMPNDADWSMNVDSVIKMVCPIGNVTIYGGRDSFIKHYSGRYATKEIDLNQTNSGTNLREITSDKIEISSDFRKGIIYSVYNQYPKVFPTVDIAVVNNNLQVLMGKKKGSKLWRFPGGFVDPSDQTLEHAATRELKEETGLDANTLKYLLSVKIEDWRYPHDDAKILTTFFICSSYTGILIASDDLHYAEFVPLASLAINEVEPVHQYLYYNLKGHYYV